ncbi:peptidase [Streptomyces sp. NPDC014894]|uniref:peptidase n=1 Tax=Streptomyces sp. NPDC014894 TaxID=3364931 RepID=UPI0036F82363
MALEEVRPETVADVNTDTDTGADLAGAEDGTAEGVAARSAKRYPVAPGHRVNVRSGPGTGYRVVRVLAYEARVPINCQKPGERITGPYGTTNIWDCIANGEYVSDAYVQTGSNGYVTVRCS